MRGAVKDETGQRVALHRGYRRGDLASLFPSVRGYPLMRHNIPFLMTYVMVFVPLIVWFAGMFYFSDVRGSIQLFFATFAAAGSLVVCISVSRVVKNRVMSPETCAACILARTCPGCGYDLRSTPAQENGRTMCPECGTIWKLGGSSVEARWKLGRN